MPKLSTKGYDLLDPGIYVLTILDEGEILEGEYQGETSIQIRHELEIAEGPNPATGSSSTSRSTQWTGR